ncbi:MAG: MBL fold metallo-hydrolase, partial [Alphaproteobacteria bacterium]
MSDEPIIRPFFDEQTFTVTYLVADPGTGAAAVIDPVLDYNPKSGKASAKQAQGVLDEAQAQGWRIERVLETHAHADHLSAAPYLKAKTGARVGIGKNITEVQSIFRPVFNATDVSGDGSEFDDLWADGERFTIGGLTVEVLDTPGHTPACIAYRIGNNVFTGDTLFMPDFGTARADFPGGDARTLYRSIRRLLSLPDETKLWMCHDYKAPGRDHYAWETTVGEQKRNNIHVGGGVTEDDFVAMREERDATLDAPTLLLPSIQTNIRAGHLPPADDNGVRYLRIPVTL